MGKQVSTAKAFCLVDTGLPDFNMIYTLLHPSYARFQFDWVTMTKSDHTYMLLKT